MCWAGVIRMLSVSWLSLFPCYYSFRYPWSEKGSLTNLSGPSSLAVGYKAQRSCHHSLCPKGMGRTGREECQWDSWEGTCTPSANQRDAPHALSTLSFTGLFLETGTKREALAKILPLLKVISLILLKGWQHLSKHWLLFVWVLLVLRRGRETQLMTNIFSCTTTISMPRFWQIKLWGEVKHNATSQFSLLFCQKDHPLP